MRAAKRAAVRKGVKITSPLTGEGSTQEAGAEPAQQDGGAKDDAAESGDDRSAGEGKTANSEDVQEQEVAPCRDR